MEFNNNKKMKRIRIFKVHQMEQKKEWKFFENNRHYLIGFYGEYDNDSITYLGAYTASVEHINYYMRRPYIFLYK